VSPPLRILLLGRRAEELWNTVAEAFPCGAIRSATMSSGSTVSAECARSRPDLVILDATIPNERAFVDTLLSIVSKTRLLAITNDAEVRQDLRSRGVATVSGEIDAGAFVDMLQFMLDYLVKPIDLPSLESTVSACLGRAAYSRRSFWERVKSRVADGKT